MSPTTRRPTSASSSAVDDRAHELVPQHALETHIAAHDLEVGVADAGQADLYKRLAGRRLGAGIFRVEMEGVTVDEGTHGFRRWEEAGGAVRAGPVTKAARSWWSAPPD